jgi:hypothetical protein
MACVLIVEDEDQVRVLADSYLQQQGHKTFSASIIDGALALLDGDQDIDLLFVDISLHDDIRAGLELAKQRRSVALNSKCSTRPEPASQMECEPGLCRTGPFCRSPTRWINSRRHSRCVLELVRRPTVQRLSMRPMSALGHKRTFLAAVPMRRNIATK